MATRSSPWCPRPRCCRAPRHSTTRRRSGHGRMVIYGTTSGQPPRLDPLAVFHRGVSVIGFASPALPAHGLTQLRKQAFALGGGDALRPIIGSVLPLSQAAAAHRNAEDRTAVGKAVLVP
nr:zinc-binding dehydrogenase [Frankia sp. AiPs1]